MSAHEYLVPALEYVHSLIEFRHRRGKVPGIAVAVTLGSKVLFNKTYGLADIERGIPLRPDTIFRVASHSKSFTATATMLLVERGVLRLDDPLSRWLPWIRKHRDPRVPRVTMRELLDHSSGIIRDGVNAEYWALHRPFPTEADLKREILAADLVIDRHVEMKYSNYAFGVAGMVIGAAAKQPFGEFVQQEILRPLKLTSTGPEYHPAIDRLAAVGYTRDEPGVGRRPIGPTDTLGLGAATGFYSNAVDLCRFFSALCPEDKRILSPDSKREMIRPAWKVSCSVAPREYGLGLMFDYAHNRRLFGHEGGFPGQNTWTRVEPETGLAVSILTNSLEQEAHAIGMGVWSVLLTMRDRYRRDRERHPSGRFKGRFMGIWSVNDYLPIGAGRVLATSPLRGWDPFADPPNELEVVNRDTLRVVRANSFDYVGEEVKFVFNRQGVPTKVFDGGCHLLPPEEYYSWLENIDRIDVPGDTPNRGAHSKLAGRARSVKKRPPGMRFRATG